MKNVIHRFNAIFGLTPNEGKVALLLVAAFLTGIGVKAYRMASGGRAPFDYAASDSEFVVRSAFPGDADSLEAPDDTAWTRADTMAVTRNRAPLTRVNLNTATLAELIALPGVGEVTARRMIAWREQNGRFTSVRDLMKINGIGPKKFERLAPLCTAGE